MDVRGSLPPGGEIRMRAVAVYFFVSKRLMPSATARAVTHVTAIARQPARRWSKYAKASKDCAIRSVG